MNSSILQRLRSRLEKAQAGIPLENLGREIFRAPLAKPEVLKQILTPLLAQLPEARVNENDWVVWESNARAETLLTESRFVVVDVETTGSSTRTSRMMEIAMYAVQNGVIAEEYATLVHPLMGVPPLITELTGITNHMVATAPRFVEVAESVRAFLADAVVVAHNAPFDCAFLRLEFGHWDAGYEFSNPSLCTVNLTRHLVPGLENYKLHTVARHFGIEIHNRHRAAGDALATAQVFIHLLQLLAGSEVFTVEGAMNLKKERKRQKSVNSRQ